MSRSERGAGSWPTTVPGVAIPGPGWVLTAWVGKDWTVATVSGDPPPATYVVPPNNTPAPSCTAAARVPAGVVAPLAGSTVYAVATDACDGARPPSTVNPLPSATTASRDTGAGSCHGATPASME